MGKTIKDENGITLIALVITIIVLLILAGVTINLTLGQNGIFKTAEQAAKNYKEAENRELGKVEGFTNIIDKTVSSIENNYPLLGTIIKTENGINYTADGEGNVIPVPVGFEAIPLEEGQGTKLTGFVIKNVQDNNEFVWIPVAGMSYTYNRYAMLSTQPEDILDEDTKSMKIKYSSSSSNYFIEALPIDERDSVTRYGGYYIGRYETGIEGGILSLDTNTDSSKEWTGWTNGTLVVQPGKQVWNYITKDKAVKVATELYNKEDDNVTSKLCSSYAWDTALKFMESTGSTYPIDSVGGYYGQSAPTTTGYDKTHPCNIYDMGGNVWEWTTESSSDPSYQYVNRGGGYNNSLSWVPAFFRDDVSETNATPYLGSRIALFM